MALSGMKINTDLRILGNIFSNESAYQQPVLDRQVDATLDPGASPATGDRYTIENSAALHANFGTITGVGDDDIVEYDGTNFTIAWDASAQGEGALVWDKDSNQQIQFNGTAWATQGAVVSTDSTIDGDGSGGSPLSLAADAVDSTKIADNAVGNEHLQDNAVGTAEIAALAVTTAKIAADAVDGTKIADDAIGPEHLAATTAGNGLGQAAGGELDVNVDDSSIEINTDSLRVKALGIATSMLAADAIDSTKLADNAVGNEHMQDSSIDTAELATNAVTTIKITDLNVTTAKLAALAVTTAKIAADAIDGTKIADDAVDTEHLATDSVGADALDLSGLKMRSGALTDPFTASLTRTFTHNWGSTDVMVELHDVTTGEACLAAYTKTANTVVVTLNQTPANSVRVLIREIDPAQTTLVAS
jgi:hypothetical protein